ncbi:hypothetical protein [Hymenobacter chitinivorans]|uniref:Outer membrane efflux protein n=1 Tax=Hymenobacter chitinivorans DSM 11115 TaxID=1121954 RepID=A0A2M9BQR5_9BACT|nr:hypothetical protein [Hymenobacter chitinivorans]PJJ60310.1 hypothetical protein CLV45_1735 [Hymenobacter chitinivorans DSM 11115]
MKKIYVAALLLAGFMAPSAAQAGNGDESLKSRAAVLTRRMSETTKLDEGQYLKVKQLNLRMLGEVADIKARYNGTPALDEQLSQVQMRYEWDLAAILWPRQMAAYTQSKLNVTAFNGR